ncbi:hypothetical protein M9H77_26252 [Catharanthus roseus]|uniref:Uncharacterized protein n=1 Tax=Catharanthus roseus TaxID=4058 RepID=A0ACC0A9G8_CATRO|nr:hypothetical protein M9H77_26252 [Catharanthus roseus]
MALVHLKDIQHVHPSHFVDLTRQTQISTSASRNEMTTFKYDSELVKREIVRWVAVGRLTLSLSSSHPFVRLVQVALQSAYKRFPRTSLRREILKAFKEEKNIFCALYVIGVNIAQNVTQICCDYRIDNRIYSISFYNASNNDSSVSILKNNFRLILDGKLFYIRYACHILNLCKQDGYSHVEHVTNANRDIIKFVRSSAHRRLHFKSLCVEPQVTYKVFEPDVTTR